MEQLFQLSSKYATVGEDPIKNEEITIIIITLRIDSLARSNGAIRVMIKKNNFTSHLLLLGAGATSVVGLKVVNGVTEGGISGS